MEQRLIASWVTCDRPGRSSVLYFQLKTYSRRITTTFCVLDVLEKNGTASIGTARPPPPFDNINITSIGE